METMARLFPASFLALVVKSRFRFIGQATTLVVVLLFSGIAMAQTAYRLTDLGILGGAGSSSYGSAINSTGQVTGYSGTATELTHAFLWDGSTMVDLGTLGGAHSVGTGINDTGQVTGRAQTASGLYHAFLWNGISMVDLGTLGRFESFGADINNSGQVTGSLKSGGTTTAFLWNGTSMLDLGTLGGLHSEGSAINESGSVTGRASTANGAHHAFLWNGTTMLDLGTLGGASSYGVAINDSAQVTGDAETLGFQHAFLWNGISMLDLGTLGGTYSWSRAINASGQVTGHSYTAGNGAFHAFLWNGNTMTDLGALPGLVYSYGLALNNAGWVVGYSFTTDANDQRAFLWDGASLLDVNELVDVNDSLRPFVTLKVGTAINQRGEILTMGEDSRTNQQHAYVVSPLNLSPGTMTLKNHVVAGCKSVVGTIVLYEPAPPEGIKVTLRDTLASATTLESMTFPAGATRKTFTIKTTPVAVQESGAVSATIGETTLNQNLTVRPMGLLSVTLTPSTVAGSHSVTGKATLECAAGPGAMMVDLASSNPTVASPVAASIAIPQGLSWQLFTVNTNAVLAKTSATVSGTANGIRKSKTLTVTPAASASPTSLKFGYQVINTPSATLTTTLQNRGTASYSISGIALTGTNAPHYSMTEDCPVVLAAGTSCTIGVTFRPTSTGSKPAKLTITTTATSVPLSVSLSGAGVLSQ